MGSIRSPFLTRSWVFTPSYLYHRAGKYRRSHTTLTYRVLADIAPQIVPRSSAPYRLRTSYPDRPVIPPNVSNTSRRPFRSSYRNFSTTVTSRSKIPHISVHIAASSSGKGSKYRPEKSTHDYEPDQSPHALGLQKPEHSIFQKRRARPDSGQDAYFVASLGDSIDEHGTAFGVCDGVGGWSDHGIDPADFSHGLCSHMAEVARTWPSASSKPDEKLTPQHLLELGYDRVVQDAEVEAGGSTACVAIVDDGGRMRVANLGDSGFLQLRLGTVHHYSNPQTHAFNTPYQMSMTPPDIVAQAMVFGGLPLNDLPERADLADHMLRHGDILVLATDGVWDNLSSQDVLTSVSDTMRNVGAWERTHDRGFVATEKLTRLVHKDQAPRNGLPGTLQSVLAARIVGEAKSASMNRKRDGPFAKAWQLHAPYDPYHGGKVDDITALVIIAIQNDGEGHDETQKMPEIGKLKL